MSQQEDIDHKRRLLINHTRRLQILKEKAALEGTAVEPKILIEIEDIEEEIGQLQTELENLSRPRSSGVERPISTIEQIFANVQKLEEQCRTEPNNAEILVALGRHLFFLGEVQTAREKFLTARRLKPGGRGIKRGWIISASLVLGDVTTARQVLLDVRTRDEFDYRDRGYYFDIYEAWCAALEGANDSWKDLINKCLSKNLPPVDLVAPPYVYFELAAGLAASGQIELAWRAINMGDVQLLGELYMCGLASMPIFYNLHADEKYGLRLADWFDDFRGRYRLPPLKELRELTGNWRQKGTPYL